MNFQNTFNKTKVVTLHFVAYCVIITVWTLQLIANPVSGHTHPRGGAPLLQLRPRPRPPPLALPWLVTR